MRNNILKEQYGYDDSLLDYFFAANPQIPKGTFQIKKRNSK